VAERLARGENRFATKRFMPLFGIFLMTLIFIVFRSWRTLAAIILTLAAVVAIAVGLRIRSAGRIPSSQRSCR
jgi:glucose uptake protein GlcU